MRTDKRTDMTKQIVTFRNFAKAPKNVFLRKYVCGHISVFLKAESKSYLKMLGGYTYSVIRKESNIQELKDVKHLAFYLCIIFLHCASWHG